jgi:hypothetical protein
MAHVMCDLSTVSDQQLQVIKTIPSDQCHGALTIQFMEFNSCDGCHVVQFRFDCLSHKTQVMCDM